MLKGERGKISYDICRIAIQRLELWVKGGTGLSWWFLLRWASSPFTTQGDLQLWISSCRKNFVLLHEGLDIS